MAYVLWILMTLCPLLAHSESGDDGDAETSVISCSTMISFNMSSLTCETDEEDIDSMQRVELCNFNNECLDGILENDSFSFPNMRTALGIYELQMTFKGGRVQKQKINWVKIVKIPTPKVHNITFESDMLIIHIDFKHDYVSKPTFQVKVWKAGYGAKDSLAVTVEYQPVTIGAQFLKDNGVYLVRVRATPENSEGYFNGSWTAWSPVKKINVRHLIGDPPYGIYIILCTSVLLVIAIMLVALRWKKEIKAYISPNIPNPKATLAHIHREKERPPVSFSPEIFNDININRVDYAEEKQLNDEEDEEDTTGSCQSEEKHDGEVSSARLEEEMSHLKIKLLDQPEKGESQVGSQSLTSVRRDCRDETYVTMSSLYKTD